MKILNFGLAACTFCLLVFLFAEFGFSEPVMIHALTLLALIGLFPFIINQTKILISPSRMYALSIVSFVLARPLLALFDSNELIEVGDGITTGNISKTLSIISVSIWISGIGFSIVNFDKLNLFSSKPRLRFPLPSFFADFAFIIFNLLGLYFLYESWNQSQSLLSLDYFTATSDPMFYAHTKYFFTAKLFIIAWLITTPTKNNFKISALMLLVYSSGFLLIGLRGYFISYLFLYLYFLNESRVFKFIPILTGVLLLLYGSSYILEYRLGYSVYDNIFEMISKPFYQQGATFEVVFGSITYADKISECISVYEYAMKIKPFGNCVDLARGVPFEDGGFASSFFAEAYYLGLVSMMFISFLVGIALKFMNELMKLRVEPKFGTCPFAAGLILFFVIPNLVYFGRASAFDFIAKVLQSVIIIIAIYHTRSLQDNFKVRVQ